MLGACSFTHGSAVAGDADVPGCETSPPWWDPAFVARIPLSVSAPPGYTLRIDASAALAEGPDVRVVVHDTTARELDRILDSPSVEFQVPDSGSVWLYAGSGSGTPKADPKGVYLFAESFDALAVDSNGDGPFISLPANEWHVIDDGGNHVFHAAGIARHPAAIRGLTEKDLEIEARMRIGAGGGQNHVGLAARGNSMAENTMDGFVGQLQQDIQHWRIGEYTDGISPPAELMGVDRAVDRGVWYRLRLRVVSDQIDFFVDDAPVASTTKTGSDGTYVGLFAHNCDVDYDDVRVRMAMTPEPVATLGAVQRCE